MFGENLSSRRGSYALVLNSHQNKQPVGTDTWIKKTEEAVRWAVERDYTIVSSIGINTYELVTYLTASMGGKLLLILPRSTKPDRLQLQTLMDFSIEQGSAEFVEVPASDAKPKSWWKDRDQEAVLLANVILPVSIDPRGSLAKLISKPDVSATIADNFRCGYKIQARSLGVSISSENITVDPNHEWKYVVHWTSSSNGPWPNETSSDFYSSVLQSKDEYTHSGLNTLLNILRTRTIFGSDAHMKSKNRCVAFSGLHPTEAIRLMKLRRRYMRFTFEPYGIAIDRELAQRIGVKPVVYGTPEDFTKLDEERKPYFQNEGARGGQWRDEDEHRFVGNLELSTVPSKMMAVIVKDSTEIERAEKLCNCDIVVLSEVASSV